MARKLKSAEEALSPEIVMRDISSSNTMNDAEVTLDTATGSYSINKGLLIKESQEFVDFVVSSAIDSAAGRGEFTVPVHIPQKIEEYVLLLLRNTYFYNVQKIDTVNNVFKINWSNVVIYREKSGAWNNSLYYRNEQVFPVYISGGVTTEYTLVYSYYLASTKEEGKQLYEKITLPE